MRIKPQTHGQKIAETMTVETFMNELSSSFVGKLFEGENGEPNTILLMQKYLDEGRGSSLEQILMGRAIGELVKLQDQVVALKEELLDTLEGAGVLHERIEEANIRISEYVPSPVVRGILPPYGASPAGDCTLSIENVMKICREDEQNQLAEMIEGQSIATRYENALQKLAQEEANFNNEQFNNNKGDMK
jgi:hypothetical protein